MKEFYLLEFHILEPVSSLLSANHVNYKHGFSKTILTGDSCNETNSENCIKYTTELFKTCLMLDVISFMKYIRSSLLSLNRVPSS